jgi:hypothetical protein
MYKEKKGLDHQTDLSQNETAANPLPRSRMMMQ